jgi:small subunit ribosomal protein S8
MLTRIRNAVQRKHPVVEMPSSKVKTAIAEVLRDEGYIRGFQVLEDGFRRKLRVELKYTEDKQPVVTGLRRVSKPGLRVYTPVDGIPRVYGGLGIAVLSTPKGVMSGQRARQMRVGGEVLCYVW